jgi:hypothetical protein
MKRQLSYFKNDKIRIGDLIGEMEFLLNSIQSVDQRWKQNIDNELEVLEEIYADALDKGLNTIEDDLSKQLLKQSISNILIQISALMQKNDE